MRTAAIVAFLVVIAVGGIRALRSANREAEARRHGRSKKQLEQLRRFDGQ